MPEKDYLGKDQRKTKDDKKVEDKPIRALDEAEIALLKSYVSAAISHLIPYCVIIATLDLLII